MSAWLEINDVGVDFTFSGRDGKTKKLKALSSVDLKINKGAILGIVGESGSGKSTLAKVICGLHGQTSGNLMFEGKELGTSRSSWERRKIQMVFQDPGASLNPAMTVRRMLTQLLRYHKLVPPDQLENRLVELMRLVNMPRASLDARPRSLSGGQRQRIAIARALALEPELLVADEPTAALDVSVQASVLNLLRELVRDLNMTMVFISHDLATVRHVCDEVAVMYLGEIVEFAKADELFVSPRHPYSIALLQSVPQLGQPLQETSFIVDGEQPSSLEKIVGCSFKTRCPLADETCVVEKPVLSNGKHRFACHHSINHGKKTNAEIINGS